MTNYTGSSIKNQSFLIAQKYLILSLIYKKAKLSKNWDKYKSFQKACKKQFKKAEQEYIMRAINKGMEQKNSKPFWRYIKSKKRDNIGISPLKLDGALCYDSKTKAEILLNQFKNLCSQNLMVTYLHHQKAIQQSTTS